MVAGTRLHGSLAVTPGEVALSILPLSHVFERAAAYYFFAHGVTTVYAHLSRIGVRSGQRVGQGQYLGAVGSTGLATGPHLHLEMHIDGRPVNPAARM